MIPEKYANHTFQMKAELSPDSLTLAYCCKSGEINLVDVQTGEHRALIQGDFQMVKKMAFSPDGRYLIVQEAYGAWGIYCFDLQMAEPRAEFPHMKDLASGDFAVDGLGNLAVSRREWIEIFDLADMKLLLRFRADHVVKSCTLRFIGTQLCVRTDAACLSLYPF